MGSLYSCLRDLNNGLSAVNGAAALWCLAQQSNFFQSTFTSLIETTLGGIQQLQRTFRPAHHPELALTAACELLFECWFCSLYQTNRGWFSLLNFPNVLLLFEVPDSPCACSVCIHIYGCSRVRAYTYTRIWPRVPERWGRGAWRFSAQSRLQTHTDSRWSAASSLAYWLATSRAVVPSFFPSFLFLRCLKAVKGAALFWGLKNTVSQSSKCSINSCGDGCDFHRALSVRGPSSFALRLQLAVQSSGIQPVGWDSWSLNLNRDVVRQRPWNAAFASCFHIGFGSQFADILKTCSSYFFYICSSLTLLRITACL